MAPQREWFEKDYYAALGVSKEASAKEITKAYRKLARKLHPDANPDDAAAEARFKEVSAAYGVVGDDDKRREYDEVRAMGPMGGFGGPGGFSPGGMGGQFDLGDLFGGLFGQGGGMGGRGGHAARRGVDLETRLALSFEDAAHGITTSINLVSDVPCMTCSGSGARPGTRPRTCEACGGQGVQAENQGPFSFSRPCGQCGGRGRMVDDPCGSCRGAGVVRRPRSVKVRIPAGVEDDQRIRLKGRGEPGQGGPAGDLYVVVAVAQHDLFERRGVNLTLTVPITYPEAVLGAEVSVPTLDDEPVTLKVPAGTRSGRTFRVRGRGVRTKRLKGDLLVTVEVFVPESTTQGERSAVEALADAMGAAGGELRSDLTG
ncbi:MAG: molecular chaperone DnaJ [Acidimicrobiales bacterium]|jgi:molecular chaperone DnaJ|nr:molecular chaperone DnaJ [Acidimicrobiales bacterium]MDP6648709.1 molecular chaperone DnaJ [Acidimicrobiales bacterium]MDP6759288.1 molecular chaperone DnaJ [Acidimicrobiales bacterium]|tara:strand:- start:3147 stop:4262 length:1116 start_codon:yes stop_codon:yes gene_type:complete